MPFLLQIYVCGNLRPLISLCTSNEHIHNHTSVKILPIVIIWQPRWSRCTNIQFHVYLWDRFNARYIYFTRIVRAPRYHSWYQCPDVAHKLAKTTHWTYIAITSKANELTSLHANRDRVTADHIYVECVGCVCVCICG